MRILSANNIRHTLVGALAVSLALSLACSRAVQQGHADAPIAATADDIRPLRVGQDAPRFVVETVAGAPYHFEPRRLERPVILIAFRGGWCPYCNLHLSELRHVLPADELLATARELAAQ